MSTRVTTDDLAVAELACRHEAECYELDDTTALALIRVADWLYNERLHRYRRMGKRTLPKLLGYASWHVGVAVTEKDEQR